MKLYHTSWLNHRAWLTGFCLFVAILANAQPSVDVKARFNAPEKSNASAKSDGQLTDTLEGMRIFLKASSAYQHLPLQIDLQMLKSTNLVADARDTIRLDARFFLQEEGSYVSFGELEQVVNDSLMLLVNSKQKKMILYAHKGSVSEQMKRWLGVQWADSSLLKMEKRYSASPPMTENGSSLAQLKSRSLLSHTQLPNEDISIRYDPGTFEPSEVVQTRRALVPLNAEEYQRFSAQPDFAGKLIQAADSHYYLIREQVTDYRYQRITHDAGKPLPVQVADRISRNGSGRYSPQKGYADFALNQQF